MRKAFILAITMLFCLNLFACSSETEMNQIAQVIYTQTSGSILPELQWSEQFSLAPHNSSLERNSKVNPNQVNVGTWSISVEEKSLDVLFSSLRGLQCKKLKRIDPEDAPDGGGSESFTIRYQDGSKCEMTYDPGVTYLHGDEYTVLIRDFIHTIELTADSKSRENFPAP